MRCLEAVRAYQPNCRFYSAGSSEEFGDVDYSPQDGPDGLVVDMEGNLYVAVRDKTRPGIYVYSAEGKELDYQRTPDLPTNVGFGRGQENKTLYITSGGKLHRIKTLKVGYHLPVQ